MTSIYLDYNASTPADPRAVEAMLPFFSEMAANASSVDHLRGHIASQAVSRAREHVADLVAARPAEVVFTSGATEANNLAILGTLKTAPPDHQLVVSKIEHPAVVEPARQWGERLRLLRVDHRGRVDLDDLDDALGQPTALVSVMTANNETGLVQPIEAIVARCAAVGVPVHTDAAQAAGRIPIAATVRNAAMVSLSAHKLYGPQGVGALVIRRSAPRARPTAIQAGGGQERALRPGTLNVPGIVGFGAACRLVVEGLDAETERNHQIGSLLRGGLAAAWPPCRELSDPSAGLPQTLSVRLPGIDSHALVRLVSERIALSTGSACSTTRVEPSHVLLAMGLTAAEADECVRLSWGRFTTDDEALEAVSVLTEALTQLRPLAAA